MTRIVPLPALSERYEMSVISTANGNVETSQPNGTRRRQSVLIASDPQSDLLPIDCILVYDRSQDQASEHTVIDQGPRRQVSVSELRENFEHYLEKRQGLTLKRVTAEANTFVQIHAPFRTLLATAEKIRMKLPIERIENDDDSSETPATRSSWERLTQWMKKPFRLEPSLWTNDPDYYTAIYSSTISQFTELFDTLRGSRDAYFTPSERSLLTYELLSRAHCDREAEDEDQPEKLVPIHRDVPNETQKSTKRHGIDRLIGKKAYKSYFPLHERLRDEVHSIDDRDLNDREKLQKHWATMRRCFKFQPLSLIRSYMGEKVAFYFALCGFYNQMLIPAAIVGFIIFLYGISSVVSDRPTSDICGSYGQSTYMCPRCDKTCPFWKLSDSCLYSKISYVFDNTATVIFAILISLWARWFVEFWKRRQAVLQYDWDSINFEEHLEPIRPSFENQAKKKGEERMNPVTGIKEPYVPTRKRMPFILIAAVVVLLMMGIVCLTVFGTIAYRVRLDFLLRKTNVTTYAPIIITVTSAVINLICSIILSRFYYWIAQKLTDFEMHKYQSKYDDSLTIKIYLFQFVNFYSSLFYIAFFKGRFLEYPSKYGESGSRDFTEQCDPAGCLVELSIQFVIIMIGKQLINNVFEFIVAMSRSFLRWWSSDQRKTESQWEIDNQLFVFDSNTLIDEYLELVIQFGFITLFVTAFPLAPLFALFNNIIELRLDAWKFLSKYKRPIPHKAADIGIWSDVLSGISYFAVLTNAIVIAWTSEFIPKMAYRSMESTGSQLAGYVNWTLSAFPIADYNLTDTMPAGVPENLTYCRYRDFRETTGPNYSQTNIYWNVTAARLAFIIVFEHVIFFVIYLMQWLVPDVPKKIQNKIDHERYIDQRERWMSKSADDPLRATVISSEAIARMMRSGTTGSGREHSDERDVTLGHVRHRLETTVTAVSSGEFR